MSRRDIHAEITARIIAALEAGTPPWRRPWGKGGPAPSWPRNAVTGRPYRGINALLLAWHPLALAGGDPRWCTYNQARDKGWQVRKGEKGTVIIFFKRIEIDDEESDDDPRIIPVLKTFVVFHAGQIDGMPPWERPAPPSPDWQAPQAVKALLTASGVTLRIGGREASYSIARDLIRLPPEALFRSPEGWAATALHELAHATAHPSRLDREISRHYGSPAYALEELRAELASAFVCAELGLPPDLEQHASYIDGWLEALRGDKRAVFRAASAAQGIADWILALIPNPNAEGSVS
ncbi:ArdC family protein [Magnetospirillum aberrantis]|uniref:DUF1738 domain-containing protein n=1 Tax=Magnetospirillum aberrantis SpK TaxID=908842 RepID=A0A7C9QU74_9PROT|nr:zincin-like metallopeptidase domain-containing protein [Magnetospirillum aberrantis]NFV80684.1 DUF1738 domain-containing protein [Magnetospirillum aberrantis SpK]